MKKVILSLFISGLISVSFVYGQGADTVLKNTVAKLSNALNHVTEKAYLHFDRPYPYYVAGENIYFKAYVTMGERHELTDISSILHVDFLGANNVILKTLVLQLNNGIGWGDFSLPDTLQHGSYKIRAYTEWMRNEKTPYYFEQYISISTANSAYTQVQAPKTGVPDLQFFPEGGNMVANVKSKIGFKATAPGGLGISVTGVIVDENNREVAKFNSTHLGMGFFVFTPLNNVKYKAKVAYANGFKNTVDLPSVETNGISLAVSMDDPTKVEINVTSNKTFFAENLNSEFKVLVYFSGKMKIYKAKLTDPILTITIPSKDLPTGISRITLLSAAGNALAERLVFVRNSDLLNLSLIFDKVTYEKRGLVNVKLNARDAQDKAIIGYFSVSVIDQSKVLVDENSENTILSYLLLNSEVKGYVEKPNYYFANDDNETRRSLDELMLTQGYRRFVWKELAVNVLQQRKPFAPERSLMISGYLRSKTGIGISNATLNLIPDAGQPLLTQTDLNGKFVFSNLTFTTGTHFLLKVIGGAGKNASVILDRPAEIPYSVSNNMINDSFDANADILALVQSNRPAEAATASIVTSNLRRENFKYIKKNINYRSSSLAGPGSADQVIFGDEIKTAPTMVDGLNGIARGVDFINGVPYRRGYQIVGGKTSSMLLVVDGAIIGLDQDINSINPSTVQTVEILKEINAAIYGENANAGVIVINSKQGSEAVQNESVKMAPGLFSIIPTGYYKAREFFAPQYTINTPESKIKDDRTTIFWKPDVITTADGNATFRYFNSDGVGNYRVVVEGIDGRGNLGRQVFHYKVN